MKRSYAKLGLTAARTALARGGFERAASRGHWHFCGRRFQHSTILQLIKAGEAVMVGDRVVAAEGLRHA